MTDHFTQVSRPTMRSQFAFDGFLFESVTLNKILKENTVEVTLSAATSYSTNLLDNDSLWKVKVVVQDDLLGTVTNSIKTLIYALRTRVSGATMRVSFLDGAGNAESYLNIEGVTLDAAVLDLNYTDNYTSVAEWVLTFSAKDIERTLD